MKKIIILFIVVLLPLSVKAEKIDKDIVAYEVKYYKTIVQDNMSLMSLNQTKTLTVEISEDEYNSANKEFSPLTMIETEYKKMETTISTSGSQYTYKVKLTWKNMPKVRSYDIIGIGFLPSVTIDGNVSFSQTYCISSTNCSSSTKSTIKTSSTGATAVFNLPTGTYISMSQTLLFKVKKNTTSTIISQVAAGDYSHATSSITSTNASKHTIDSNGIALNANINSYYDAINTAKATWSGRW